VFLDILPHTDTFRKNIFTLKPGDTVNIDTFLHYLVGIGYERAEIVEGPGQIAVRGGIVDIFCPTWQKPVRVELWGDEVDSLREIDYLTQRSVDSLDEIVIYPAKENYPNNEEHGKKTLLDYLPQDTLIFVDEPARLSQMMDDIGIIEYNEFLRQSEKFSRILLASIATSAQIAGYATHGIFSFTVKSGMVIQNRIDLLLEDIRYLADSGYRILILTGGTGKMERLTGELDGVGLLPYVQLSPGALNQSFEYPHIKFAVLTGGDIYGTAKTNRKKQRRDGRPVTSFDDLAVGDYIVHTTHGIGVYRGIERIMTDDVKRDYLKISYADGGNLYISAAGLDSLSKYIGGEDAKPKIHKLGGHEFAKIKARARGAVAEIAAELKDLYAKRETTKGHYYSPDTVWQTEFEESFPHAETGDQLAAVSDIKSDMEKGKVMDRLICGDVGYGKTEVAIRAAFKVVIEGKQVAFLAPTTILAQQHYNTLSQRMRDFPVTVDIMSRFRTQSQMKETIKKVQAGSVDITVGTHRLLSKDVKFKDLGLIVVDEEQRFGVAHKERLKQLRTNVNVLTLSATPIPRTLHMSLTGIRDMSVLDEPPSERIPIQTYLMESNPNSVKEAISRELSRGGQVYYLHNRVRNIHDVADKLQTLVPEANIGVGHGQMAERELESVMMDFIQGEINVLVCTTIIENGLDIPNANTIIIQDADYLGLATLYQLRGRVGRSNRAAYCYLMYHKDKVLSEVAEKRLQVIRAFTEFGAGYKIAMRDLSMRGAGDVLGARQHGHMDAVGIEMYLKLLDEAVGNVGRDTPGVMNLEHETLIDIPIDAYIPERYIPYEAAKLEAYRRISEITDGESYKDVLDELIDRYGEPPRSVINLLDIAKLKATARSLGAVSVIKKAGKLNVTFLPNANVSPDKLTESITRHKGRLTFVATAENPMVSYKPPGGEQEHIALGRVLLELV
ncbi:MAG: transcription-repair coupling factor, partial [Defluviitaleaceae bacterium]|nr:transcription-repair coupling factor [Defluviitaleaceae bacterium]